MSLLHKYIVYPIIFKVNNLQVHKELANLNAFDVNCYDNISSYQNAKLKILISHAINDNVFYKNKYKNIDTNDISLKNLHKIPVLYKYEMSDLYKAAMPNKYKIVRDTAGTTGKPIKIAVDSAALTSQLAMRYHLYSWYNIYLGDKEARFWGRPVTNKMYKIKDFLLNRRRFMFSGDEEIDNNIALDIIKYEPDYFYGYSSMILNAAIFWEKKKLPAISLKAIICTAENIEKYQVEYIENIFKCPVVIEYGCSECDIIAFQCNYKQLHIASPNIIYEVDNITRGFGELLITDLNNHAMPLLRYNTGDMVSVLNDKCKCGRNLPTMGKIQGRSIDQIIIGNNIEVHAVQIAYAIEEVANKGYLIKQFKITYDEKVVTIIISINTDISKFVNELTPKIEKIFKSKMLFKIEIADIPVSLGHKYSYYEKI